MSDHPVTDADSRSDACPGLHQLSARLLQFVALWDCRQPTMASTVRPERGAAARLITGTRRAEHTTPVLQSLQWLPVRQRILFKLAMLVHKCLNGRAPAYLADDWRLIRYRRSGLRSSSATKLEVPPTRTTFGDRSFAVDGPRVWNSLPASIRDPSLTLAVFSNRLKTHLFEQWLRRL